MMGMVLLNRQLPSRYDRIFPVDWSDQHLMSFGLMQKIKIELGMPCLFMIQIAWLAGILIKNW